MTPLPFNDQKSVKARALFVGERLDLRAFEKTHRLASGPLTVTAGEAGCAVLFRYGCVVLFCMSAMEEVTFLKDLAPFLKGPFTEPESEEAQVAQDPGRPEGTGEQDIVLHAFTPERLQLVAEVLAKSVVLAHY